MPKQYLAIRNKKAAENRRKGMSRDKALEAAKTSAAKIYNSIHPNNPLRRD